MRIRGAGLGEAKSKYDAEYMHHLQKRLEKQCDDICHHISKNFEEMDIDNVDALEELSDICKAMSKRTEKFRNEVFSKHIR